MKNAVYFENFITNLSSRAARIKGGAGTEGDRRSKRVFSSMKP